MGLLPRRGGVVASETPVVGANVGATSGAYKARSVTVTPMEMFHPDHCCPEGFDHSVYFGSSPFLWLNQSLMD